MLAPMAILAGLCLFIGLAPALVVPLLDRAILSWLPGDESTSLAGLGSGAFVPFGALSAVSLGLLGACALITFLAAFRRGKRESSGTWDCGYAKPDARMQYTASSFARTIVGYFAWILRPKTHGPEIRGAFPGPSEMDSHVDEIVLDRALVPGLRSLRERFGWFRRFQQGSTQNYILFVFIALIALLMTLIPYKELFGRIFSL